MKSNSVKAAIAPVIIIAVGFLTAAIASRFISEWAFVPLAIVYWGLMFFVTKPTKSKLAEYLRMPMVNRPLSLLAFVPVLFCLVSFIWGLRYIGNGLQVILWIAFAVINSFAEELFWRGYLFDNLHWAPSVKIIYTTILFSASHPLMWGIFSVTIRSSIMIIPLLVMGLSWGFVYHKTQTLRWCIAAHFLVDLLNLSVWVFLNIYIPPIIS